MFRMNCPSLKCLYIFNGSGTQIYGNVSFDVKIDRDGEGGGRDGAREGDDGELRNVNDGRSVEDGNRMFRSYLYQHNLLEGHFYGKSRSISEITMMHC